MSANYHTSEALRKPAGMRSLRLALMGLAAVVGIVLIATYLRGSDTQGEARRASPQEVAAMRRAIERSMAEEPDYAAFFERLKSAYPAEYESFVSKASHRAATAGGAAPVDGLMIEAARDLRRTHGLSAARADGPALDRLFDARRAVLDALASSDRALCVDFLYGGGSGDFSAFSRAHRVLFAAMANAGLDAIDEGRIKQMERAAPHDDDFRTLENALRAQGVSNAAIGALLDGKAPNPPLADAEMCQAGQTYLRTLAALPDPARRRIYGLSIALMAHS